MGKDYLKLEGKELDYLYDGDQKVRLVVIGCDPDIGITMAAVKDKTDNHVCFNAPGGPGIKKNGGWDNDEQHKKVYDACFKFGVAAIEAGSFDQQEFRQIKTKAAGRQQHMFAGNLTCAFSQ
jgi:hypothetical protein